MNYFIVLVMALQVGAVVFEWMNGQFYAGVLWFGCALTNWAILNGGAK